MLIKPAHLVVCDKCKQHAHIVLSDGTELPEFRSILIAFEQIAEAFNKGQLTEPEVDYLIEELSKLEEKDFPSLPTAMHVLEKMFFDVMREGNQISTSPPSHQTLRNVNGRTLH